MTLNQFMCFAAIAKHGSLTSASEMYVSQPSISQQILAQNYGVTLYWQSGTGLD